MTCNIVKGTETQRAVSKGKSVAKTSDLFCLTVFGGRYVFRVSPHIETITARGMRRRCLAAEVGQSGYARKPTTLPKGVPPPEGIAKILEQPDLGTAMGLRDRAMLEVLYSCGLRKSELIALTMDALDVHTVGARPAAGRNYPPVCGWTSSTFLG
jgi:integrase